MYSKYYNKRYVGDIKKAIAQLDKYVFNGWEIKPKVTVVETAGHLLNNEIELNIDFCDTTEDFTWLEGPIGFIEGWIVSKYGTIDD